MPDADVEERVRLVVGLGNPGETYHATRHNVGFAVVDRLHALLIEAGAVAAEVPLTGGQLARITLPGADATPAQELLLLRPMLYMNRSGGPTSAVAAHFAIDPPRILAVFDDLDLPLGRLRMRRGGGHGGHNGVRDLIAHLRVGEGSESTGDVSLAAEPPPDFPRLRLGIGKPSECSTEDHVLGRFTPEEEPIATALVEAAAEAALAWIREGIDAAMQRANAIDLGRDA